MTQALHDKNFVFRKLNQGDIEEFNDCSAMPFR